MAFVSSSVSISHLNSFRNQGFTAYMKPLSKSGALELPDFKEVISPAKLRRLGTLLRISAVAGVSAVKDAGWDQPGAISVGTGLGCLADTEKFLRSFVDNPSDEALSPTPFIQSTHNTIGGLLSLLLVNHGYNMTHTQNALSFEHALIDALSLLGNGEERVLVGAADEAIDELNRIAEAMDIKTGLLTSGATFFALENKQASVAISDCKVKEQCDDHRTQIDRFLEHNNLDCSKVGLLLYAGKVDKAVTDQAIMAVDYTPYTGNYFTNSALATHMAVDVLSSQKPVIAGSELNSPENALVVNHLVSGKLGLVLINKSEA